MRLTAISSITLGFVHTPISDGASYTPWHVWPVFGVVLGTNLVGLLVVILRRDIVWTIAATWICVSIWSERPKPTPIYVRCSLYALFFPDVSFFKATVVACTVIHPLALLAAEAYHRFHKRQAIALPGEDHRPGVYRGEEERRRETEGPREVNEDNIWTGQS